MDQALVTVRIPRDRIDHKSRTCADDYITHVVDGTQSCTQEGCQCTDQTPIEEWSPALVNTTRMFWEAQLQAFEHNSAGYFLWSIHGYGGWSLVDLFNYGVVGPTINDRYYGRQCAFSV